MIIVFILGGCNWLAPGGIGLEDGQLKPCPESPNCVSSLGEGEHQIKPLPYSGTTVETRDRTLTFLDQRYGATVETKSDTYLHLTVSTTLGFVDDLQFQFVPNQRIVHVRSASRAGYDDLGTNRSRIEELRVYLNEH